MRNNPDVKTKLPSTTSELRQIAWEWSKGAKQDYPQTCIHQLFEAQARRTPDRTAIVFKNQHWTYQQLNLRADQIAASIQTSGGGVGEVVAVLLDRSFDLVASMLGVLKSGAAFLLLDRNFPRAHLQFLVEDSDVRLLVTRSELRVLLPNFARQVIHLDASFSSQAADFVPIPETAMDHAAYIMYTSGSTGKPKGVRLPHRGVVNYLAWLQVEFELAPEDVVLQLAAVSFDPILREIFAPLMVGARLVLLDEADSKSPMAILAQICEQRVTCLLAVVPTMLRALLEASPSTSQFSTLRLVLVSGELFLTTDWQRATRKIGSHVLFVNQYGPTECTMITTYHPITQAPTGTSVPIGKPISNTEVLILDQQGCLARPNSPGEVCIGGVGVAQDYLNRPELTARSFIPHPFTPVQKLYRTGDFARCLPDGSLEFIGRMDTQTKVRGYRIELGEIESVLRQHPTVRDAAVLAQQGPDGAMLLVAYIIPRSGKAPTEEALRGFAIQTLPDYMVPSRFAFISAFPLTSSGKLDRRALPLLRWSADVPDRDYIAPTSAVQQKLAAIFAEILQVAYVGVNDDFFHFGGHSLSATQALVRINQRFHTALNLRDFFENPSVLGIEQLVNRYTASQLNHGTDKALRATPITQVAATREPEIQKDSRPPNPAPEAGQVLRESSDEPSGALPRTSISKGTTISPSPLSFAQERLWFLDQLEPDTALYNIAEQVRLRGNLDVEALQRALTKIVARHEALRTTFIQTDGVPLQVIGTADRFELPLVDLSDLPSNEQHSELCRLSEGEALRPFNLAQDLMIRAKLVRLAAKQHILLLTVHHIASDGWSMSVLYRELGALYRAYISGTAPELSELPIQYADFALWQREWLRDEVFEEQISYWKQKLGELVEFEHLRTDRPRPTRTSYNGAREVSYLSANLVEKLKSLARAENCSIFMVLLAGFKVLLHRYSGHQWIQVGSPIANRTKVEVEKLIGFFVNTLILRTDFSGEPSFRELLGRVRQTTLEAYDYQDLPFEKLVEALQPERSLSHTPLFQVMFSFENMPSVVLDMPGLTAESVEIDSLLSKFDLTLTVSFKDGLRVAASYNTNLFEAPTIRRMLSHYQILLEGIVADPSCAVDKLRILSEAEHRQIVTEWNDTRRDYPNKCVHQLFEEQVRDHPDSPALLDAEKKVSYRELNQKANRLAHRLGDLGVGPEVRVGICLERSAEFIIGILAILKAGGTYVPLDPAYPRERLTFMIEDSGIEVLISTTAFAQKLSPQKSTVLCMDLLDQASGEDYADLSPLVSLDSPAYIMYTSGSTGTPKGVEILHRGIIRLLRGVDYIRFSRKEVSLHMAPTAFDASTFEIWGALLEGSPLVLYPHQVPTARELGDVIQNCGVTTMWLTTSLFNAVIEEFPEALQPLRQLIIGGEALSVPHVQRALAALPDTQIINGYGPTETTTFACCYPIPRSSTEFLTTVPIGRPIANTTAYILNPSMQLAPIGAVGELYIGGDGLARGYVNAPELNHQRFVSDPFSARACDRLYKTGDLARFRGDGLIEFVGRVDDQVKVRGFRIELGEIESAMAQHPAIKSAAVTVGDGAGDRMLVAYVVPREGHVLTAETVTSFLKQKLPRHLIPTRVVFLEELPLTRNGKVDRRALPVPQLDINLIVGPRNVTEARLLNIWKTLFPNSEVGVTDNFFDLGGHSLLASSLLARIQQEFGQRISMARIFESPTVEGLALLLREGTPAELPAVKPTQPARLVKVHTAGSRRPLFFFNTPVDEVLKLAGYLGEEQPVYALQFPGLEGEPLPPAIEIMAASYLEAVRTFQPHGPYLLGGYCIGGLVAFEMAQQLRALGEKVDLVVVIDIAANTHLRLHHRLLAATARLLGLDAGEQLDWFLHFQTFVACFNELSGFKRVTFVLEKINNLKALAKQLPRIPWRTFRRNRINASTQPVAWTLEKPENLWADSTIEHYSRLVTGYVAYPYAGRITVIRSNDCRQHSTDDPTLGWRQVSSDIELHVVPGDHQTCVRDSIPILAARLRSCLDRLCA
jgi:amino acid adenylation domain-containing protein